MWDGFVAPGGPPTFLWNVGHGQMQQVDSHTCTARFADSAVQVWHGCH